MRYPIKKNVDLDNLFGAKLGKAIRELRRRETWARLPTSLKVCREKPQFFLNDGSTLQAYSLDLVNGTVEGEHYCGSADTAIHHTGEQFSKGYCPPENTALLFISTYWNGRNTSWELTVVSQNFAPLLAEKN